MYVAGQSSPLREDAVVELPIGALIRLLPPGSKPLWAAPLAFALWHPRYWPSGVVVPRVRESACALILHSSGKYLFDRFCGDDWANQNGIAALVEVPLAEVRMQAANPAEMLPYVYRGSPVRGVIAVVERGPFRDDEGRPKPYIVFLAIPDPLGSTSTLWFAIGSSFPLIGCCNIYKSRPRTDGDLSSREGSGKGKGSSSIQVRSWCLGFNDVTLK